METLNQDEVIVTLPRTNEDTLALRIGFLQPNLSKLLGEVLTVIDASMTGTQNKAVKDLIRTKFYQKVDWFQEVAHTVKDTKGYGEFGYPFEGEVVPVR